jgi:hypothetical protein
MISPRQEQLSETIFSGIVARILKELTRVSVRKAYSLLSTVFHRVTGSGATD